LGVRPEHLGLGAGGTWPGFTVELVEPMGADNLAWCKAGDLSLAVRTAGDQVPREGTIATLALDPARVSLFAADSGERL
jgi:multiple sugar transport system ATP-binding protein